jgi:DUF4097 and DUF4098 domain-containing protein YvlB
MDEERARILKLLEDGKITAQEAEKLLLAIKHQAPHEVSRDDIRSRMQRFGLHAGRRMPELVTQVVSDALEDGLDSAVRKQRFEFESKGKLMLRNVSGDTEIEGWDRPSVRFARNEGGLWKANEREGMIMAKVLSGDLKVKVPFHTQVIANTVSGNVEMKNVNGKTEIKSVSGDIELRNLKGSLDLSTTSGDIRIRDLEGKCHILTVSGDVDLGFRSELSGHVETKSGDVRVWVPSDANVLVEAEIVEEGEVTNSVEAACEKIEEKPGHTKLGFGTKEHHLWIRCRSGDIELCSYEPAQPAAPETPEIKEQR